MDPLRIFVVLVAGLTVCACTATRALTARSVGCDPVQTGSIQPGALEHLSGEYDLIMVAWSGSRRGAVASGTLWLARTSSRDQSPSTEKSAPPGDTAPYTFFGATDVRLLDVGAPISVAREALEPHPTSRDPLFPGVLVRQQGGGATLLVSTLHNRRTGETWLDGAGIMLPILFADSQGFGGTWGNYGILADGSGHFCAHRRAF